MKSPKLPFQIPRKLLVFLCTTFIAMTYFGCGDDEINVLEPVAKPIALTSDRAAMEEEAKVLIDEGDYKGAADILEDVIADNKTDNNDARVLYAYAQLGLAGLNIWEIIIDYSKSNSESGSLSVDNLLESLSGAFLGAGEERAAKINALSSGMASLRGAPQPDEDKITKIGCVFAALLAIPTVVEAEAAMERMVTALNSIKDSASSGGGTCPDISLLDSASTDVGTSAANFTAILASASHCPFLNLDETAEAMNTVQESLVSLTQKADLGCSNLPEACPASRPNCHELFPACVQEAMKIGAGNEAVKGDGVLASCEIALHCTDPSACF